MRQCIRHFHPLSARHGAVLLRHECQSFSRESSTQANANASVNSNSLVAKLNPRWLSDVKARLGKCMTFGLDELQTQEAGRILQTISRDWRSLVAGSEGFITHGERGGLHRYPIAWGEQDPMAHINNVVYNRWAESSRIAWARNFATLYPQHAAWWLQLMVPKGEGLILRKITTEYKFPMKYPDRVTLYHKLSSEPNSSDAFLLDGIILSERHQRIAARTTEDIALYDYDQAKKVDKQPWLVDVLKETWRLQEETRQVNGERVRGLLDQVRQLELASWDRIDAVEK